MVSEPSAITKQGCVAVQHCVIMSCLVQYQGWNPRDPMYTQFWVDSRHNKSQEMRGETHLFTRLMDGETALWANSSFDCQVSPPP